MKIFYGICGEGMGHGGRSLAMIERLESLGHQVTIFTYKDALRLLAQAGYQPHAIAGVQFCQKPSGAVDTPRTLCDFSGFLRRKRESIDLIRQMALVERPDLFITDFEPLTAAAAAALGIECASIDNQHRFCHPLGRGFPWHLQVYGRLAGQFVRHWIQGPRACIVAVFHDCPPSRHYRHVDVLLRRQIAALVPREDEHVLVYARAGIGRRLAEVAAAVPSARFIVYGCDGPRADNVEYKPTSHEMFARDLASCRAVICSAGQQLIGEACYFGKPLLAVPIPKQHEQQINACYVERERIGEHCPIDDASPARVQRFLGCRFAAARRGNGVDQALDLLGIHHG